MNTSKKTSWQLTPEEKATSAYQRAYDRIFDFDYEMDDVRTHQLIAQNTRAILRKEKSVA